MSNIANLHEICLPSLLITNKDCGTIIRLKCLTNLKLNLRVMTKIIFIKKIFFMKIINSYCMWAFDALKNIFYKIKNNSQYIHSL